MLRIRPVAVSQEEEFAPFKFPTNQIMLDGHTLTMVGDATLPITGTSTQTFTPGSVPFAGGDGVLDEDNDHFFWVTGANPYLRLSSNEVGFRLRGEDHIYMEFYPSGSAGGRYGWIGYGWSGSDVLQITSQKGEMRLHAASGQNISFYPGGSEQFVFNENGNFEVLHADGQIIFRGTHGGGGSGVLYEDTGGTARYGLNFQSGVVILSNRAENGTVELRANTATAGGGGEETVAEVQDTVFNLKKPLAYDTRDTKQISGGSIAVDGSGYIRLQAETGTTDLLGEITGASLGMILVLESDTGDTINVLDKTDVGGINIELPGTRTLNSPHDKLVLFYDGSRWAEISYSNNA